MARKVTQAVVSYLDTDGNWQVALRGTEIEPHKDDLGRLEGAGAFDAPAPSPEEDAIADVSSDVPAGNASLEDWQEYARSQGASDADLEDKSRNDLRDEFGN